MAGEPEDIYEFFKSVRDELAVKKFKAAMEAAQTLTLYIDISCRTNFKKSRGGAGLAGSFKEAPVVEKSGKLMTGSYSPLPYAGIRDRGGIIRRRTKRLAVPMTKKAEQTGSPLNWKSNKKLIYVNKGYRRGYAGSLVTIQKQRTKTTPAVVITQYALRNFVKHPKSNYLGWAADMATPEIAKITADFAVKAFVDSKARRV